MKAQEMAYRILPHLVATARQRKTTSYGELAGKAGLKHWRPLSFALAFVRDNLCTPKKLPMLNVLVVNKKTGRPGEGFLPEGTKHLSEKQYNNRFEKERDVVFMYPGWEDLLASLGMNPIKTSLEGLDQEAFGYLKYQKRGGEQEESNEHKLLKKYVVTHPECLGLPASAVGTVEYPFPSGDECDVVFAGNPKHSVVVEIKTGKNRGDLVKGVYQAVKYRALMEACKGHGKPHDVRSFLAAFSIPKDVKTLAKRLMIAPVVVNPKAVGI